MKKYFIVMILMLLILPNLSLGAEPLQDRLSGKILLQVEDNGEAWYLEPITKQRAFLGQPADAFRVMRELGLGISENDYGKFKYRAPQNLSGRILLRVETNGEAYYVRPETLELIYLNRPADAFRIMREQGLGITNNDLEAIAINKKYSVIDGTVEISLEEAKVIAVEFINDYLVASGQEVSVKEVVVENGLYKVVVNMTSGEEVNSFLSKDGKTFFPSGMNIEEYGAEKDDVSDEMPATPKVDSSDVSKNDKPKVELFVMSHCPFGTQMEKGLLPVLDVLGDSIDFELKFNDYAMHSKKELDEQLSQYCVQKNNPEKLQEYLYCFLEDEAKSEACLAEVEIDSAKHSACVITTDEEYQITEMYNDKNTWKSDRFPVFSIYEEDNKKYGVTGSPTLIINGVKMQTARDSQALLSIICASFNDKPSVCQAELSDISPSAGFGFGNSGSNTTAACGS